MQQVVRDLAEVVEHVVYSHTFRSEKTSNRVHELLGKIRAGLDAFDPAPAEAEKPAELATPAAPAEQAGVPDAG